MKITNYYERDTFARPVVWYETDGKTVKDVSGATVQALVTRPDGTVVEITGAVLNGPAGEVVASAAGGTFSVGIHELQVIVIIGGVVDTFAETFPVRRSTPAPA